MFCTKCGTQMPDDAKFCTVCGEQFVKAAPQQAAPQQTYQQATQQAPQQAAPQQTYQQPAQTVYVAKNAVVTADDLPEKYKPLSAWAYFGLQILFAIPVIGFIFLIIFSCNGSNVNRRSFARSYWCSLILCVIILTIVFIIALATGGLSELIQAIRYRF